MVRTVHCPRCGLELEAPPELVGKPATCPRCTSRFMVGTKPSLVGTKPSLVGTNPSREAETTEPTGDANVTGENSASRVASGLSPPSNSVAVNAMQGQGEQHPSEGRLPGDDIARTTGQGSNGINSPSVASSEPDSKLATSPSTVGASGKLRLDARNTRAARFKGLPGGESEETVSRESPAAQPSGDRSRKERSAANGSSIASDSIDTRDSSASRQVLAKPEDSKPLSSVDGSEIQRPTGGAPWQAENVVEPLAASSRLKDNSAKQTHRRSSQEIESPQRNRKAAKLLGATSAPSKLKLGADGALPELVVAEGASKRRQRVEQTEQNPLPLIIVLSVSVVTSLFILFMPTSFSAPQNVSRRRALEHIEEYYLGKEPFAAYQILLREAIQEEHRGNRTAAIERYREVLDMLHAEGLDPKRGVSGPAFANRPPNDKDLEEQLQILIRRRN